MWVWQLHSLYPLSVWCPCPRETREQCSETGSQLYVTHHSCRLTCTVWDAAWCWTFHLILKYVDSWVPESVEVSYISLSKLLECSWTWMTFTWMVCITCHFSGLPSPWSLYEALPWYCGLQLLTCPVKSRHVDYACSLHLVLLVQPVYPVYIFTWHSV